MVSMVRFVGVMNEVESVAVHLHLGEPLRALVALVAVVALVALVAVMALVAVVTLMALEDG